MIGKILRRKSVIAALACVPVLTIVRIVLLITSVEYPAGIYTFGSEGTYTAYYMLLAFCALVIAVTVLLDLKANKGFAVNEISRKSVWEIGFVMIISGAAALPTIISGLGNGFGIYTASSLLISVSSITYGVIIIRDREIKPACCVGAMGIIIGFLIRTVVYFTESPLITKTPQQLITILIYIITTIFWINTGRMFSGGERRLTRTVAVTAGFFCSALSVSNIFASFAVAFIDTAKWMYLTDLPDFESIVNSVIPAALAIIFLYAEKRQEPQADDETAKPKPQQTNDELTQEHKERMRAEQIKENIGLIQANREQQLQEERKRAEREAMEQMAQADAESEQQELGE